MGVTNVRGQYISHYKECKNKIKLVWRVVKYFIMNINTIVLENHTKNHICIQYSIYILSLLCVAAISKYLQ